MYWPQVDVARSRVGVGCVFLILDQNRALSDLKTASNRDCLPDQHTFVPTLLSPQLKIVKKGMPESEE